MKTPKWTMVQGPIKPNLPKPEKPTRFPPQTPPPPAPERPTQRPSDPPVGPPHETPTHPQTNTVLHIVGFTMHPRGASTARKSGRF
jgi:hypothetical protein